ncbi:MAG: DNA topoisomerase VI subunit B [Candidatus Micrarchaeota archaeon]
MTDGEKIFKQFREHSVAEFFKKNRQMLGFTGKVRSLTMIVHEFVTNGLDAAEEAGILPDIFVKVEELGDEHYRLTIRDNGPGIPKKHLGKALGQMLAGTKFHRFIQQRGQQGIGASACVMFSYITTGTSAQVVSCSGNMRYSCSIGIDFKTNSPVIKDLVEEETEDHGLTVVSEYKEVKYERSNKGVFEYLRRTALANPHCSITLEEPSGENTVFPRSVEKNPAKPYEIKPHPMGVGPHDLLELCRQPGENRKLSAFLQNTFSRMSANKVSELRELAPGVDFDKRPEKLEWSEAEAVVKAFQQVKWIAPPTDSLVPIGKEQIEISFQNIFNPEIMMVTGRSPKIYRGGIPFSVEVGIAYGGGVRDAGKRGEVMRFANKVPLLFDTGGCAITETVKGMDWKRYNLKNFEEEPVAVLVNLVSVHVPFTSAGKQAISHEEDVMDEIKFALMEASRGIQRYLSGKRKANEIASKKKVVSRYVKQISSDLAILTGGKKSEIEKKLTEIINEKYVKAKPSKEEDELPTRGEAEPEEDAREGDEE